MFCDEFVLWLPVDIYQSATGLAHGCKISARKRTHMRTIRLLENTFCTLRISYNLKKILMRKRAFVRPVIPLFIKIVVGDASYTDAIGFKLRCHFISAFCFYILAALKPVVLDNSIILLGSRGKTLYFQRVYKA